MLLQANDYAHLHEHEGCELQIGGSDQWGNILSGVDLIRRRHGATVHALCWPLLTAADGTKLGKTTGARVWLDPELTSPVRLLPALDQRRRRRGAPDAGPVHPPADGRGRGAWWPPTPRTRPGAWPSGPWPGRSPSLVHGPEAAAGGRGGRRGALRRRSPGRPRPTPWRRWPRRCPRPRWSPGRTWPTGVDLVPVLLRTGPGLLGQATPAASSSRAGVSVNGEKAEPGRAAGARRPAARPLGAAPQGQEGLGGAGCPPELTLRGDPPIGCPSAPQRPRQRRVAAGRATPAPPLHVDATAGRALPSRGGRRSLKTEERTKKRVRATARLSSEGRAAVQE